jgi:hypothetical protein
MLYTVGHTENYDRALKDKARTGEGLYKIGRKISRSFGPYPGGIVFLTHIDAINWLKMNSHLDWSVYCLDTGRGNRYFFKKDNTFRLKHRARILKLKRKF